MCCSNQSDPARILWRESKLGIFQPHDFSRRLANREAEQRHATTTLERPEGLLMHRSGLKATEDCTDSASEVFSWTWTARHRFEELCDTVHSAIRGPIPTSRLPD